MWDIRAKRKQAMALEVPKYLDKPFDEMISIQLASRKAPIALETYVELIHLYTSLFNLIKSAKYDLILSLKEEYSQEFEITEDEKMWLRTHFIDNSILSYNASFDILLQCLWIGLGLYIDKKWPLNIGDEKHLDKILNQCRWEKVQNKANLIPSKINNQLKELYNQDARIREISNELKHRGNFVNEEGWSEPFNVISTNKHKQIIYDSSKTQDKETLSSISDMLIKYHKKLLISTETIYKGLEDIINQSLE